MAFSKLWRKKLILVKIEGTYGTDPTPAGTDALLTMNAQIRAVADQLEREYDQPYLGGKPFVLTGKRYELEFDVEVAGSGTAGTPPKYDALLRACGFSVTNTPATSDVYAPVSAAFESATIYFWAEGQRHILLGCRGSVSLDLTIRQYGKWRFRMTGFYAAPTDTTQATPTYANQATPLAISESNWVATLDSYDMQANSLQIDLSNDVQHLESSEDEEVVILDRRTSGSAQIYAPNVATKNLWTQATGHGLLAFSTALTGSGGNIVTVAGPKVQAGMPDIAELNGNVGYTIPLSFTPNAGNDELTITFT